MWVRHQAVNQRDAAHPSQKCHGRRRKRVVFIINFSERLAGFAENLRQGNIHHRTAGKCQTKRQHARIGRFGKHHQAAA